MKTSSIDNNYSSQYWLLQQKTSIMLLLVVN